MKYVIRMRKRPRFINGIRDLVEYIPFDEIVMVELGCYAGESVRLFAESNKVLRIYGVDKWEAGYDENDYASDSNMEFVENLFDNLVGKSQKCLKIKADSSEAAKMFDDGSLDFVYVDAMHTYDAVKKDILSWMPKINDRGYIGGHDYPIIARQGRNRFLGVKKVVDELFGKPEKIFQDTSWIVKL